MRKVFVITGGACGIGKCLVETFARLGNVVYFIDKDEARLQATERELTEQGLGVFGYAGDVAEQEVLEKFHAWVMAQQPEGIHCLINNACLSRKGILSRCGYDDFLYVQRVGVAAPYWLTLLFKDEFIGMGSVVNISSTRAFQSQPDTESYTAAKGGITALTHALAVSLGGKVRVNAIAPGWIDTGKYGATGMAEAFTDADRNQHPSGRIGEPQDIARVVEFLCDDRNSFINGELITVDGGMTRNMIYHNDFGWKYEDPSDHRHA